MSILNNTKRLEIQEAIKKSGYFTIDDFDINFNPDNNYLVEITFISYPYFSFIILENEVRDNIKSNFLAIESEYKTKDVIQTMECPGEYKENETKNFNNIDSCIYRISKWVRNLHDDLQNISEVKDTTNNTKDMKEELDKHFNDIETFNSQEIIKLHKLLDELKEKIEELEKSLEISNDEAKNLIKIVDDGKINLELMPKKTWFITTWNKLKNIDNNIKTMLGFKDTVFNLIEYATKLLG
jgi:hypothetical protein